MARYRIGGYSTVRGEFEIELEPVHLAKFILKQESGRDNTMLTELAMEDNQINGLVTMVQVWDESNELWMNLIES